MTFKRFTNIHESLVDEVPSLKRGRVWCRTCGHSEAVDAAECLRTGWPKHCGHTMTIDSPEEQAKGQSEGPS